MSELIEFSTLSPERIFVTGGSSQIIDSIRAKVEGIVPDLSTNKGRSEIASLANKVARTKTTLDKAGKALADHLNAKLKPINSERKLIRDSLDKIKEEVRKPLTDWENREKERVANHQNNLMIFDVSWYDVSENISSDEILAYKNRIEQTAVNDSWQEFQVIAENQKITAISYFAEAFDKAKEREKKQAEYERLKREEDERKRLEREEQIRKEATEKAEREKQEAIKKAERDKAEALKRAEQEKLAAIEAEKQRQLAEQMRLEAEQKAKEEQERLRSEDKEYRRKINASILKAFIDHGLYDEHARELIKSILSGKIKNISINY